MDETNTRDVRLSRSEKMVSNVTIRKDFDSYKLLIDSSSKHTFSIFLRVRIMLDIQTKVSVMLFRPRKYEASSNFLVSPLCRMKTA